MRVRICPEFPELVVSDQGDVWGPSGKRLSLFPDKNGYRRLNLYRSRMWKQVAVHAVVCTAFHGSRPEGQLVRHLNGDHQDNRACNLAWGTHKDNEADKSAHSRNLAGARHHQARLTEGDVLHIRSSGMSGVELAALYGVSPQTISQVLHRKTWRHV